PSLPLQRPFPIRTPAPTASTAPCLQARSRPWLPPSPCRRRPCRRRFAHHPSPPRAPVRTLAAWVRAARQRSPEATRTGGMRIAAFFRAVPFQEPPMSISSSATPRASCLPAAVIAALLPCAAFGQDAGVTQLDTVHVEGHLDPAESERARTPGNVTIVEGGSFRQRTVNNMADALRYVPGVWAQSSTGGDGIFLSSRGSNLDATDYDNNGVRLFQDGLPVTAADGNNHNRFMDPMNASRVVVAHGANALTYGASTLGGAIDFITPTARDGAPMQLAFNVGSFGLASARLTAGGVSGDVDGQLTLETKDRDGYREHGREHRTGLYA